MDFIHVYIHVPFCIDTCGYCDFYRQPHQADRERAYVEALLAEMGMRIPCGSRIVTLYFGGGTPSLLSAASWDSIFGRLAARAEMGGDAEISIEANPASVTVETAQMWRRLGINRVSVGVQSLNDRILRYLDRIHTAEVALAALDHLRAAGMPAVNADLIYGIEGQTTGDIAHAIDRIAPRIDHLSTYALTIAPNTPFGRKGITVPDADAVADQYDLIVARADEHGFERYEVSNFARPGFECRHNLNTWRYGACIALGPSAVGFDGSLRYKNSANLAQYIKEIDEGLMPQSETETPDRETAFRDRLMLGLRTREGVKLPDADLTRFRNMAEEAGLADDVEWSVDGARMKPSRLAVLDEFLIRLHMGVSCR